MHLAEVRKYGYYIHAFMCVYTRARLHVHAECRFCSKSLSPTICMQLIEVTPLSFLKRGTCLGH
jgi:hypothetical protein